MNNEMNDRVPYREEIHGNHDSNDGVILHVDDLAQAPVENVRPEGNQINPVTNTPMSPPCAASKMIADLSLNSTFTAVSLDKISEACNIYTRRLRNFIKSKFRNFLSDKEVVFDDAEIDEFMQSLELNKPFCNIGGSDKHIKNIQKHWNLVPSKSHFLGNRTEQRYNKVTKTHELTEIPETFQVVSIIDILKLIMTHEEIKNHVDSEKIQADGWLENYCDGKSYREHPFYQRYPRAFRFTLYNDDFIVNSAIGTKVQAHKLGGLYIKIQNLPHYLMNFLGGIFVIGLYYSADKEKYGLERILEPFMRDMRRLESDEGVNCQVNGRNIVLRASVPSIAADTLAAHELMGLLGPAARHFCRMCMINRDDLKRGLLQNHPDRSDELYRQHVEIVKRDPSKETETGLRTDSPLHAMRYCRCPKIRCLDIMHDSLCGQAQLQIKLSILHWVSCKDYDFDVDLLNTRIDKFLSDKIPEDDQHLQALLLLARVNEIIFAFKLNVSILPYLTALVTDYQKEFFRLYHELLDAINKLHHFSHMAECICKSGPLREYACLIFEQKHGPFKKVGTICCNYKNIPKTLMNHNQINQAAIWGTGEPPREKVDPNAKSRETRVARTQSRDGLIALGFDDETVVFKATKISVWGIEYAENLLVALHSGVGTEEGLPLFGIMKEIVVGVNPDRVFLFCKNCTTIGLEESLNAYLVEAGRGFRLIDVDDLVDKKPFNIWSDHKTKKSYICLRQILL
ncbi:hypothetical protein QAD02_004031 [Eretmocerus hayati]|uniref:Uncharacterized protein n=1 Tax=Eretmocerus hayati TaxID=131215 RepID=A0ACC2NNP8_9HYME|nr:hypothetical protein QAD02_004031 [Eretmocerus hayati]